MTRSNQQGRETTGEVINHHDGRPFTEREAELLEAFAAHAAAAIENARLYCRTVQAKSEFPDFVPHELKQPMTAMQGYAKMLTLGFDGELTETQKQFVQVIDSNVNRMGRLVSDLLEISRLEAGRTKLKLAPAW